MVYCIAWAGISTIIFYTVRVFNLLAGTKIEMGVCLYRTHDIKLAASWGNVKFSYRQQIWNSQIYSNFKDNDMEPV